MSFFYPGQFNTYLISHDATNNLIVAYSRNPKDFACAEYMQIVPVTKTTGAYLKITPEEAGRVLDSTLTAFRWDDGQESPEHNEGLESHDWATYRAARYAFGFNLGDLTVEQASWDILSMHAQIHAQQAMTARTVSVQNKLLTTSNWDSNHFSTAASIPNSGQFDQGTVTNLYLKQALNYAAQKTIKDTLGQVKPKDLVTVMNPADAAAISMSQEVHSYIKESPFALAQLRGDSPSQNGKYGMPDYIYGYRIIIEDAVKTTSAKGATTAHAYVMTTQNVLMLARVGGIEARYGGPSFSTATLFMMEEMTVETKRDDDNRRTKGRVVENYDIVMTAPIAGYLFTSATSAS